MSIISGTASVPLIRLPIGADLNLIVNMDSDYSLTGKTATFYIRAKDGNPNRQWSTNSTQAQLSISGQVVTIDAPASTETVPAFTGGWTLADVQAFNNTEWRLDFNATGEAVSLRLQGEIEWIKQEGLFDGGSATVDAPSIDVTITEGAISVSVAVAGGSSVPADASITNAKLANMAQATIKGRAAGAGAGVPVDLTASQVRTILNVADGATAFNPAVPGPIGGTTPGAGTFTSLASADSVAISDMTDAWNDSGTTFYADKMVVTDTASAAESRLFSRWLGASEKIGVRKDGQLITVADILLGNGVYFKNAVGQNFFYFDWAGNLLCGQDFQPFYNENQSLGATPRRWKQLLLGKTITAPATTGAQTINKASGSVNFAAAAISLVVTNSLVTTGSVILCTVGTNDSTMLSVQAVAASGSFTIHANAAATAETRVDFVIFN